jgi:hypothetical protein
LKRIAGTASTSFTQRNQSFFNTATAWPAIRAVWEAATEDHTAQLIIQPVTALVIIEIVRFRNLKFGNNLPS